MPVAKGNMGRRTSPLDIKVPSQTVREHMINCKDGSNSIQQGQGKVTARWICIR